MVQLVKYLLPMHEDLSLDPQHLCLFIVVCVCACDTVYVVYRHVFV